MSSTSLFPASAEPPGGAEPVLPSSLVTDLLVAVGRFRRSRRKGAQRAIDSDLARFGYADPPEYLDSRLIELALPHSDSRDFPPDRDTDFDPSDPTMLARAWAALIAAEVDRIGLTNIVRGVDSAACGFVSDRGRIGFGLICYVRRWGLAQAAPLVLDVDGVMVPVVLRPLPRIIDNAGALSFQRGLAVGSARLGHDVGTLTAAHVVAPEGDSAALLEGDKVLCCESGCTGHPVVRTDAVMDAALVGTGSATGLEQVIRTMPVPGYFPVEMRTPSGSLVEGWVTEVPLPEGVIPGSRGRRPTSPAMLTLSFAGEHGWSGGLVRETQSRASFGLDGLPYGMFLGARLLRTALVGRMNMLAQLEIIWNIELLEE